MTKDGKKTGGRQKGTPNTKTAAAREVALAFLHRRTGDEIDALWTAAKSESPTDAMRMYWGAVEFILPKLARTELVGEGGGALVFKIEDE